MITIIANFVVVRSLFFQIFKKKKKCLKMKKKRVINGIDKRVSACIQWGEQNFYNKFSQLMACPLNYSKCCHPKSNTTLSHQGYSAV